MKFEVLDRIVIIQFNDIYLVAVEDDPSALPAMNSLESLPGMSTPENVIPVPCPGAPRRRGTIIVSDQSDEETPMERSL
ncbi:unnamed protein product [Gongylonema pulchrum]|uniref:LSM domain-containing protein n=1 Tax=Gongylonema pulchrum TaxID=637853 RepID=A0A183D100_9BILA|nr:unnamed protein product [Gongylonema pulchrum]